MADFMKVDMSRLGQAEGRSADSGMAAPSGADVDTFRQAMRRGPLDERQGSGGDESDGGRGASHAPDEDTSAEAEALSSMFSRMRVYGKPPQRRIAEKDYHEALRTPGISPLYASSLKQIRQTP